MSWSSATPRAAMSHTVLMRTRVFAGATDHLRFCLTFFRFDLQDEADRPRLVERSSRAESCQVEAGVMQIGRSERPFRFEADLRFPRNPDYCDS